MKAKYLFAIIGLMFISVLTMSFSNDKNVDVVPNEDNTIFVENLSNHAITTISNDGFEVMHETIGIYLAKDSSLEFIVKESHVNLKTLVVTDIYRSDSHKITFTYSLTSGATCYWTSPDGSMVSVIDTQGPTSMVSYYDSSGNLTRRYFTSDSAARSACAMMQ